FGLTPGTPKPSIQSVLAAYNLGTGNTIAVDAGDSSLTSNIVQPASASHITISGYHDSAHPDRGTVLDRNNYSYGSFVIELAGATNVTLDHLSVTGGLDGIHASDNAHSTGLTISNSDIYGNSSTGIVLLSTNDDAHILNNRVHDQVRYTGMYVTSARAMISGNMVYNNPDKGIGVYGADTQVSGNEVYGNYNGIEVVFDGSVADQVVASGNLVHDNYGNYGMYGRSVCLFVGNTVYGQTNGTGMVMEPGTARDNVAHDNAVGISAGGLAEGNRVYHNSRFGIITGASAIVRGNVIYSNPVGIRDYFDGLYNSSQVLNNLIYASTDAGILVAVPYRAGSPLIANNTVYQPSGDAVRILDGAPHVRLRNNILWTEAGYDLIVPASSEVGFQSDYNDLYVTGTGKLGRWEGRDFTSRADWFYELSLDQHSISADPLFVNPAGSDGILGYDATTGSDRGLDDDFHVQGNSPTVDAGDPADDFSQEPGPNGGRINQGSYGNTSAATPSQARLVQILSPNGLEKFQVGQDVTISWRSAGLDPAQSTVSVKLSTDGGNSWITLAASVGLDANGQGSIQWTPSAETSGNATLIRVTSNQDSQAQDTSDAPFLITNGGHDYYINDASDAGDVFTTAVGNNSNSGKGPDQPMFSLSTLLAAYALGPGDTIHVDTGTYNLVHNVVLTPAHSGIRIEGPANGVALLNRNNFSDGSYVIQLAGATDVTLDRLSMTGGQYGIFAADNAHSTGLTVTHSDIYGNFLFTNNLVYGHATGINVDRGTATDNVVHDNAVGIADGGLAEGNRVYHNSRFGIITGFSSIVRGNVVYSNPIGIRDFFDGYY